MTKTCPKCSKEFEFTEGGRGRPPTYCGDTCRRLAEFEIRRVSRELDRLEERRIRLRDDVLADSYLKDFHGRAASRQYEHCALLIEEQENRLRALLDR